MQALRRANILARLVLAWFVFAVGVAVASPVFKPVSMELVCSSGGSFHLVDGQDRGKPAHAGQLDCPLCLPMVAPPPAPLARVPEPLPSLAHAVQPFPAARIAALVGAPLPPRGPPSA